VEKNWCEFLPGQEWAYPALSQFYVQKVKGQSQGYTALVGRLHTSALG